MKKRKLLLGGLVFLFLVSFILGVPVDVIPLSGTCTPVENSPCSNSYDNNIGTFWSTAATNPSSVFPQRVSYDLGEVKCLTGVKIYVGAEWDGGTPIIIEGSNDLITWHYIDTMEGSANNWAQDSFSDVNYRYLRISFTGITGTNKKWNTIYEFRAIVNDERCIIPDCYDNSQNPIPICTCNDLQKMNNHLNNDNVVFQLQNDIDCSMTTDWNPLCDGIAPYCGFKAIGGSTDAVNPFMGELDGNGKIIKNLFSQHYTRFSNGLFGFTQGAYIHDLGLENAVIGARVRDIGALIGYSNNSIIEKCFTTGRISFNTDYSVCGGGFIGSGLNTTIKNSYSRVQVGEAGSQTYPNQYVGGFAGCLTGYSILLNSYSANVFTGINPSNYHGGFFGLGQSSTNSYTKSFWDSVLANPVSYDEGYLYQDVPNIYKNQTGDLYKQNTFSGWDFVNTWWIQESVNYPQLWFQVCTPDCSSRECGVGNPGCGDNSECGTCTNQHGTTSCTVDGICNPVCSINWADCDLNRVNGCETDLNNDNNNCGACGNICSPAESCMNGVCTSPGNVYWADMNMHAITEADIGDTVLMVYEDTRAGHKFDIKEKDILVSDDIRVGNNSITGSVVGSTTIAKWTITDEDVANAGSEATMNFYFRVDGQESGELAVLENSMDNSPPVISIAAPQMDDKFKAGNVIGFEIVVSDEDDDLAVSWNFGDSVETYQNCLTGTDCNATHVYSNSGTKIISAEAKEMTRQKKARDETRIFVYENGVNIFPLISQPPVGTIITGTRNVDFDASQSYVAQCSSFCPASLPYGIVDCYKVSTLECYDLNNVQGIPGDYNLFFNWTFSEGDNLYGNWKDNYDSAVVFDRTFISPIRHWAKLNLGYEKV